MTHALDTAGEFPALHGTAVLSFSGTAKLETTQGLDADVPLFAGCGLGTRNGAPEGCFCHLAGRPGELTEGQVVASHGRHYRVGACLAVLAKRAKKSQRGKAQRFPLLAPSGRFGSERRNL